MDLHTNSQNEKRRHSTMFRLILLTGVLAGSLPLATQLQAGEATTIERTINGQNCRMLLTGSAVRTKVIFKIYTVDSYVEEGLKVHTAQDMIDVDGPKQLHLVMLRSVGGAEMAEAFVQSVRAQFPAPAFNEEIETVAKQMRALAVKKGDEIWFTHIPKVGFQCQLSTGTSYLVRNAEFSKAIWSNYFGKHVVDNIRSGLSANLPKE